MLVYKRNHYAFNLDNILLINFVLLILVRTFEYLRPGYRVNLWWQRNGVCGEGVLSCSAVGPKQKGTPQGQLIHFQTQT